MESHEAQPSPKHQCASHEPCLPSVDRALDVLELLAGCRGGVTLSDLSRRLKIPKSTAHYLIRTLMLRGYVQREIGGRHYSIGLRVSNLATFAGPELQLSTLTLPHLRQLSATFDFTATTSVLRGAEAVIIAAAPSFRDIGGGAWTGRHLDVHCTAQGKALLAFLPEGDLQKIFGHRELARYTKNTIVSIPLLKEHLSEIKKKGFAVNNQEHVIGCRAVAAPIFDHLGSPVAAISVRGLLPEVQEWRLEQIGPKLALVAHEISREMRGSSDRLH